jgi:hypothetical protein
VPLRGVLNVNRAHPVRRTTIDVVPHIPRRNGAAVNSHGLSTIARTRRSQMTTDH